MKEFNSLPESISHRELNLFLDAAKNKFELSNESNKRLPKESDAFNELLEEWLLASKDVLKYLNKNHSDVANHKSSKSLMALGAFEVHLKMAIQARKAVETDN